MRFAASPSSAVADKAIVTHSIGWALLASAMLFESDVYRYVTIAMVVYAFVRHRSNVNQISNDWLAVLCYAWTAYVLLRFIGELLLFGEKGSSEWLYAFPAFFPLIGVALYVSRRYMFSAATLLIFVGLLALLATLDYRVIFHGERAAPLYHHNPIHAGVGSSMLFISSLFWMLYAAETGRLTHRWKLPILAVGSSTAFLSLVGILGAHSKGAWLALAATMVCMAVLSLHHMFGRWRVYLLPALVLIAVIGSTIASPYIQEVAGATVIAADKLADDVLDDPSGAVAAAIADADTPHAMRERLMLWWNAYELVEASPLVGWGNLWLREWGKRSYDEVKHTLLHNGYLELLVRHGLFGIAFLLIFSLTVFKRLNSAHSNGKIASSLAAYIYSISFFFFCTITTNSNNRLALGESFFILAGSAIFALTLLEANRLQPENVT